MAQSVTIRSRIELKASGTIITEQRATAIDRRARRPVDGIETVEYIYEGETPTWARNCATENVSSHLVLTLVVDLSNDYHSGTYARR